MNIDWGPDQKDDSEQGVLKGRMKTSGDLMSLLSRLLPVQVWLITCILSVLTYSLILLCNYLYEKTESINRLLNYSLKH